jgi:hypothetical protein
VNDPAHPEPTSTLGLLRWILATLIGGLALVFGFALTWQIGDRSDGFGGWVLTLAAAAATVAAAVWLYRGLRGPKA